MKVWIVAVGEPLPIDAAANRPHRCGMIAEVLVRRGHEVLWWTSTLDHVRKEHRYKSATTIKISTNLMLRLLHGVRYSRNISLRRLWNHYQIGRQFRREAAAMSKPDIILSSFPTIELSESSAAIGKEAGIPVLIDVRDLWPDIFVQYLPKIARPLGHLLVKPLIRDTSKAFRNCAGIIGTSEQYLTFGLSYAERTRGARDAVFPLGYARQEAESADLESASAKLVEMGVDPKKTICWFVGSFGATYDLAPVIEVARRIERSHRNVQFVFSGDGERFEEWSNDAAGLENVMFTGWLNADGLASLSRSAKVGLAAYGQGAPQSLPNKIFEYLSAGLPIVTSLGGECKALLDAYDCGATYVPGDSASLLAALTPYLEDETRRSHCGANASRLFQNQFRSEAIYARMADFLEEVARQRGNPQCTALRSSGRPVQNDVLLSS